MNLQEENHNTHREQIANLPQSQSDLSDQNEPSPCCRSPNRSQSVSRSICEITSTRGSTKEIDDTIVIKCANKKLIVQNVLKPLTIVLNNSCYVDKIDKNKPEYRRKQPNTVIQRQREEKTRCRKRLRETSRINNDHSTDKGDPVSKTLFVENDNGEISVVELIEDIDNTRFHTKSRGLSRCRSRGHSRGRSRGRSRDRSRGHSRGRSRGRSRGKSRGHSRHRSRGHSRGKSRGHSRGRSRGNSRGKSRSHSRRKSRGHSRCRSRGHPRDKSRNDSQGASSERSREKSRGSSDESRGHSPRRLKGTSRGSSRCHSRGKSGKDSRCVSRCQQFQTKMEDSFSEYNTRLIRRRNV